MEGHLSKKKKKWTGSARKKGEQTGGKKKAGGERSNSHRKLRFPKSDQYTIEDFIRRKKKGPPDKKYRPP